MSPETATQDRIYLAIKHDYLVGLFRPADRIDIRAIADRHHTSVTPVREVLSRLAGERVFEHRPEGGFRPALPDAARLAGMYALHRDLVMGAIAAADGQHLRRLLLDHRARTMTRDPLAVAQFTRAFFAAIAAVGQNVELEDCVANLGERLQLVRMAESEVLGAIEQELRALTRNGLVDIRKVVGRRIVRYHEIRISRADDIVAMLFK